MSARSGTAEAFRTLVLAILFVVLVGYILVVGKSLLMPIFVSVISVYVLVAANNWLGEQPITRVLPSSIRTLLVIACFVLAIVSLGSVVMATAEELASRAPDYRKNLLGLFEDLTALVGVDIAPDWEKIWEGSFGQIQFQTVVGSVLAPASSLAGIIFMVIIYTMFLMGERQYFPNKIATALPGDQAAQLQKIVQHVNKSVSDYLGVKTLINVILATISYAILWFFGVDFAVFWAVLIGLLNYIPYIGSMLGVTFPVLLTIAQFGSLQTTILVAALLGSAQVFVGNYLEPRMIGKSLNLSPFVVMVSLALWSTLWGVSGAILAIPLTSIVAIILAAFKLTRPFAILLAEDVSVFAKTEVAGGQQ